MVDSATLSSFVAYCAVLGLLGFSAAFDSHKLSLLSVSVERIIRPIKLSQYVQDVVQHSFGPGLRRWVGWLSQAGIRLAVSLL